MTFQGIPTWEYKDLDVLVVQFLQERLNSENVVVSTLRGEPDQEASYSQILVVRDGGFEENSGATRTVTYTLMIFSPSESECDHITSLTTKFARVLALQESIALSVITGTANRIENPTVLSLNAIEIELTQKASSLEYIK